MNKEELDARIAELSELSLEELQELDAKRIAEGFGYPHQPMTKQEGESEEEFTTRMKEVETTKRKWRLVNDIDTECHIASLQASLLKDREKEKYSVEANRVMDALEMEIKELQRKISIWQRKEATKPKAKYKKEALLCKLKILEDSYGILHMEIRQAKGLRVKEIKAKGPWPSWQERMIGHIRNGRHVTLEYRYIGVVEYKINIDEA